MSTRRIVGTAALLAFTLAVAGETTPAVAAPPAGSAAARPAPARTPSAAGTAAGAARDATPPQADAKDATAGQADPRPASWPGSDRPKVTPGVLVRAAKKAQQREAAACGPCAAQGTAQSIEIEWRAAPATP